MVVAEEYPGHAVARSAEIDSADLCGDEMRIALPPDSAGGSYEPEAALRELSGRPWVMEPADTASRRWATALCRDAGFEPDVRFESPDLLVQLRLVEQGHAVALLPDLLWGGSAPSVRLLRLPDGGRARRLFTAVRHGSGGHPAVRACRSALLRAMERARCLP
ncbi:LysR substrate-binding domain-containing protein [Streptomyces sp. E11-3]|uniref:LysR substrate-binding domain-containing protein n=1 Tax=Streptomyces sp. E11-3 TaxID=3110112 RepID=UPI003980033D